jgi:hypothetical protein
MLIALRCRIELDLVHVHPHLWSLFVGGGPNGANFSNRRWRSGKCGYQHTTTRYVLRKELTVNWHCCLPGSTKYFKLSPGGNRDRNTNLANPVIIFSRILDFFPLGQTFWPGTLCPLHPQKRHSPATLAKVGSDKVCYRRQFDVRFCVENVRFTPESGHVQCN